MKMSVAGMMCRRRMLAALSALLVCGVPAGRAVAPPPVRAAGPPPVRAAAPPAAPLVVVSRAAVLAGPAWLQLAAAQNCALPLVDPAKPTYFLVYIHYCSAVEMRIFSLEAQIQSIHNYDLLFWLNFLG